MGRPRCRVVSDAAMRAGMICCHLPASPGPHDRRTRQRRCQRLQCGQAVQGVRLRSRWRPQCTLTRAVGVGQVTAHHEAEQISAVTPHGTKQAVRRSRL